MGAPRSTVTPTNIRAFLSRPWEELEALKARHWREALEADPLVTYRASEALWERLHEQGQVDDPEARRADLEMHLRLRALFDRTAGVQAR